MSGKYGIDDLRNVMKRLLGENGCPWDKAQTHESLRQYFIEETYEVIEAINKGDKDNLCEELGDVLFQVVFHSELAERENLFLFEDVTDGITRKMIQRHPHVFADDDGNSVEKINSKWESIKKAEKGYKNNIDVVKSVPSSLPALMRSTKTISKAVKTGLDTLDFENLISENEKLSHSLKEANSMNDMEKMELIGKFYINLSKISNFLQINAEFSLTNALETYINKLEDIEMVQGAVGEIAEDQISRKPKPNK